MSILSFWKHFESYQTKSISKKKIKNTIQLSLYLYELIHAVFDLRFEVKEHNVYLQTKINFTFLLQTRKFDYFVKCQLLVKFALCCSTFIYIYLKIRQLKSIILLKFLSITSYFFYKIGSFK